MLKMLHGPEEKTDFAATGKSEKERVRIRDAAWPAPFRPGLEYNCPAHGMWNIVHTGMLLPGSHQIYVCAANCNRGVVLTAAEMGTADRFSTIAVTERDLINGKMEDLVIDGVAEILEKLDERGRRPSVVLLFTVCIHHFMGCDLRYIYRKLRERFPKQRFVDCYMDPIMQKRGLTPDQKMRRSLYACLEPREKNPRQIGLLGNNLPLQEDCDLMTMLRGAGFTVRDITGCETFEEYLSLAESSLFFTTCPPANVGAKEVSRRLNTPWVYLPQTYDYDETQAQLLDLADRLSIPAPDTVAARKACEAELSETKNLIGDTPIALDGAAVYRVLGLARLLLEHGFYVQRIYCDSFSPEEEGSWHWLNTYAPDLEICATIHANMRVFPRENSGSLAIGQKAAYFENTRHFVNMVEDGGLHGYAGIAELARLMREAFLTEKDTKDLVVRKGWGCESLI